MSLRRSSSIHTAEPPSPARATATANEDFQSNVRDDSFDIDEEDHDRDDFDFAQERPPPLSLEEKRKAWIRNALISGIFVLLWYTFSVTLSLYNKWMFSEGGLNFHFPVLTTSGHLFIQYLLATGLLLAMGKFNNTSGYQKLRDEEAVQLNRKGDEEELDEEETEVSIQMTQDGETEEQLQTSTRSSRSRWAWFKLYLKSIVPCAVASAADIGMGNVSLRFVTLTFYTMVKSSSLAWVLLFGIIFKLEVPTRMLITIIGVMTIGVIMMVAGETHFVLLGFFLVLGAAIFSGLRWSLTQLLLRASNGINTHNDPVRTIMYISPVMGTLLFLMGGVVEGYGNVVHAELWADKGLFLSLGILILPGVLAFCMTLSEFMLLGRTSVLALSIAGIAKELVTITSAALFFGDSMTLVNGLGLITTLSAIIAYNVYRYRTL